MSAVAAVAVSPLIVSPLLTPAWAERFPREGPRATASAGSVDAVTVTGAARLDAPSTITATASVTVPRRSQGTVVLTASGQTCRSSSVVPIGRSTLRASCVVIPRANQVPALPTSVEVSLDRVSNGVRSSTRRRVSRSVAMDDGDPVPREEATRRWRELTAALHAETGNATTARVAGAVRADAVDPADPASANDPVAPRRVAQSASLYAAADLASRVWAQAQRTGWSSPQTQDLLADLMAARKPDGGYGLAGPWDAFGDGTLNPVETTYTVTTAGHVGWVLIEGYKNAALPQGALSSAVDALLAMPRLNGGTCFAYSNSPHDRDEPCVYNVSHGAAAFLVRVRELTTYRAAEIDQVLAAVRTRLTVGYDWATGYWVYMAGMSTAQDISHQIYTARSVDVIDPSFHAVARMMALPWWRHPGGMTQSAAALASAMMDVATDCTYARSPAVLLAAERALGTGAPAFTVMGMAAMGDQIVSSCFG